MIVVYHDRAEILTRSGAVFVVDVDDVPAVIGVVWERNADGYAQGFRPRQLLHRYLLSAPRGMEVDHIDGALHNNRRSNLRLCTRAQNNKNRRIRVDNTSGYKGVSFDRRCGRYRAEIKCDGRRFHLGMFTSVDEAAAAYQEAARRLFGAFNRDQVLVKRS